jgi:cyanophycin synthetase
MRIETTRRLRGPNVYLDRPVLVARVRLEHLTDRETTEFPGFTARLLAALPGLNDHHCAAGRPGGFVGRLHDGTYFGHVSEHVALALSARIGRDVFFGRTTAAGPAGRYDLVLECPVDEPPDCGVAEALLRLAVDVVAETLDGHTPQLAERLDPIRAAWERVRPGPSTAAIAAAARARGIPAERVDELSLLRLGYGRHRRLAWAAMTDATSAVAVDIAGDKELTRRLLADAAVPVPAGGVATTVAQALVLLAELGPPVVVKPRSGRQGSHVYLGLDTPEAVRAAFDAAVTDSGSVVVERQLGGRDYRVLVVQGRVVAAAERLPASVVGDGVSTVAELVARANADPRRGDGHGRPLTRLHLDDVAAALLYRQRLTGGSVPAADRVVRLRDNANLSTGGTGRDVTDHVHPDVADLCRRAAELVGLDVAGIDLRLSDIAAPPPPCGTNDQAASDDRYGIIEVNAAPGLRMHLAPTEGVPRDVAAAIVTALYPPGRRADGTPPGVGRIPTVSITGTNGKTTTARLVAHLLARAGYRVGLTSTDGVYIGGHLVQKADATGPRSAQVVLADPTVDAAVLETARGGLIRYGLGYDWTDVGVLTNLAADHLGQDGVETLDDLMHVKALVAERVRDGGTLVLNADDVRVRDLIARPRTRAAHKRLFWFGLDARSPLIRRHVDNGGTAHVLADDFLLELAGGRETRLLPAADVPGGFAGAAHFAAANTLAAASAARALGLSVAEVRAGLGTFDAAHGNPGRGQLFELDGVHLLVDYAHNPAAIAAVGDLLRSVWGAERAVAAVTLPGDRRDDLITDCARVVADCFGRAVLYEDVDKRGRTPGELAELVRTEIAARRPGMMLATVRTVQEAIPAALAMANPGDVMLVLYEQIEPVLAVLDALGAREVTDVRALAPADPIGVS